MDIREAILQLNAEFNDLWKSGDPAAIAQAYLSDGAVLAPNEEAHRGKQAIENFFRNFIDEVGGSVDIQSVEIAGEGDLAYQWATYAIDAGEHSDAGKFVEVYRRRPDGSWKIRLTIFNSDNP
jgi:uncharacterized protein (TIGR02246 family)